MEPTHDQPMALLPTTSRREGSSDTMSGNGSKRTMGNVATNIGRLDANATNRTRDSTRNHRWPQTMECSYDNSDNHRPIRSSTRARGGRMGLSPGGLRVVSVEATTRVLLERVQIRKVEQEVDNGID